ncbi:Cell cycle protein GpsB [Lentibacillus sp. JNUCC-1]|uniref:cell division regulator GpsB n=1 Tax=Lentibacillus sp. JNUCC-1 TaxID=2654513 RepID=UPI0012E7414B|nr:cell division regulator GpsB [Lentibacillus sp. JNUCC-1]MUV39809.1 Cell cycle protein GpsB [Lentibacillus sp. JNUCC-1]
MTTGRTQLAINDIVEKEFKTGLRGYNQEEVDAFLDTIIQDYEALQGEITQLKQENERLKKNASSSGSSRSQQSTAPNQVNYDVLKRLSNLEKAVFGKRTMDT